jgi:glycosyltransferase involved in cell wall biosynthesis
MNICFVIDNFPSYGGIGRAIDRYSTELIKRGHKIIFISSKDGLNKKNFSILNGKRVYRLTGVLIPLTKGVYYQALPSKSLIKGILDKEKIDAVVLVSYTLLCVKMQSYLKEFNVPYTLNLYFQPENITNHIHLNLSFLRYILEKWIKYICNRASNVVVLTKFAKTVLKNYQVHTKIDIVSCGINLNEFNSERIKGEKFKTKYNLQKNRFILCVCRLTQEKNVKLLIDAASKINWKDDKNRDVKIVIIGNGKEKDKLVNLIRHYDLEDKFILTENISEDYLKSAYKECEFFVLPSLVELEGLVILEAMAFGKPILVANSHLSAARYFVLNGTNGYKFSTNNPKDLAEKITYLVNNPEKIKAMGKNSLKVVKKYSLKDSVDKIEKILAEISYKSKSSQRLKNKL